MNYRAHQITHKWPKASSFNWQLVPKKLEELAKQGTYYDDKILP